MMRRSVCFGIRREHYLLCHYRSIKNLFSSYYLFDQGAFFMFLGAFVFQLGVFDMEIRAFVLVIRSISFIIRSVGQLGAFQYTFKNRLFN